MNKTNNNNNNNNNEILSIFIIFTPLHSFYVSFPFQNPHFHRNSPHSYLYFPHFLHSHPDPLNLNPTPQTHILAYFTSFYAA